MRRRMVRKSAGAITRLHQSAHTLAEIYRLAVERTTRVRALCRRFPAAIRKCIWRLADVMAVQGEDADAEAQMQPPAPDSIHFLNGTRSHSPTTARNSTPAAAMICRPGP